MSLLTATAATAACAPEPGPAPTTPTSAPENALRVEVVASGLENPWDIGFLPGGRALVTERSGGLTLLDGLTPGATATPVQADFGDLAVGGEGGLMGLLPHPDFATNRLFLTCQNHAEDVRVITWRLAEDGSRADRVGEPLLTGLPVNPSGRHSGCRPALAEDGALLLATGDAARPDVPQDRTSLGGKVLRMDVDTGAPLPDNPFADSPNPAERLVYSYGHRNPQGVAVRPGGQVFIAEHGPDVDDEINPLRAGGNYGWDPSRGGTEDSYDESVPMTDLNRFPDAVPAVWSSGSPTEAIAGAGFLTGPQWGALDGVLAVPALKGSKLLLFRLAEDGRVEQVSVPPELDGTHGRLRTLRQGPDGAAYVTTDNGTDDEVLRITAN
ncbi:PQQ-dependent sugar dehydrogenase [Saccharopolyspora cebuensis]|uniref:PQQ-dependent sugar dehydrogenase n=1 Tax=Saccharopolyspora cebuensis TaxID=418759 RepID=UPI0035100720